MIRKAIRSEAKRQGLTGYRLGKMSAVPIRTVQRFLADADVNISVDTAEALAAALGLELKRKR